ncbi:ABC transporter permease [Streptomyces sp. NPDC054949]|uniref:ABC transporter permease n=1 Tax=unclassified Streptomyces TaxID=2593676 RepID=UPI0006ADD881|nr:MULTISPECIES: ABC transporter permease [unclassified Streptomyces]KOU45541.1 ABC transporter permease [Streptomyces sp. WM4235]MCX5074018.1 ABC transporter permease [Streptomyces sp. NBC_00424]WUD42772.1 ABC transporter permease [Streptomyces sp. NBC_00513]
MRARRLVPPRLSPRDVFHVGSAGLRSRPVRVFLSALGIAIGIATMIAVVGISSSSQAKLLRELDKLGTNMLVVTPGQSMFSGQDTKLPKDAPGMIGRIEGVESVGTTGDVKESVRRSENIPKEETGAIAVKAARDRLLDTLRARMAKGTWLNEATGRYPSVVLGDVSARRLGITEPGRQVFIGGRYFTVIGILEPIPLAPEIERSALVGWEAAERLLGFDGHPTAVYERSADDRVTAVRDLVGRTANPSSPSTVSVTDPSAALQAKAATEGAFSTLLLGLGGIALLVGGVGVANTMIISVLERRHEIGLRRSLGATKGQVRIQFVTESLLLSGLGGAAGIVLGGAATAVYARVGDLPWVVPLWAVTGGFASTLAIGTFAGLYPAVRAARLSPTLALQAG